MQRIADAGGQDLALEIVVVEDPSDLAHQIHADVADVVETPEERADVGGARLRRQERLRGGEDQRGVDPDPLRREGLDRAQSFADEGILTTTFLATFARSRPSRIISSAVTLTTSALTGPGATTAQISLSASMKSRPSFETRVGLVVTPSRMPQEGPPGSP